ncbi:hypothetical protein ACS7SF_22830 (plasmid) [Ralstonia sp. 25C]|uniref:hypothetical protein n=1 Tax=Ralstonia sp. 25C TaxID=3447363 RepID=UPI003F75033A
MYQEVHVDGPSFIAEKYSESEKDYYRALVCEGCGKDFEARIISNLYETTVEVDGAIGLTHEIVMDAIHEDEEISWVIELTEQLDNFRKVMTDVVALLKISTAGDTKITLFNMLYAQAVTAVEAYLSGIFIHTVVNSNALIRKLVETDPELSKRQFSLKEIFTQWEGLKILVAKYLKDLIFHDLKKVKPMYRDVLGIDFGDVGWLFKAVLIRHDCVHRNGVDKDGNPTGIEEEHVIDLIKKCSALVANIDEQVQYVLDVTPN